MGHNIQSPSIKEMGIYQINNFKNPTKQSISLEELLKMEVFEGVINSGEEYFKKEIKNVTVIEDRKFEFWLKGGELVLTTLQHFDTAEKQLVLIDTLVEKEAACLAYHPGNTSVTLFEESINYCKEKGLPCIKFPKTIPYVDVFEAIYGTILNNQALLLKRSNVIRKKLTDNILDGDNLEKVLHTLSNLIGNPVGVTNVSLTPLVFNSSGDINDKFHQEIFEKVIAHLKEILNPNPKKMLENNVYHYELHDSDKVIPGIVFPVVLDRKIIRYLHVWELNHSLKEIDFIALSHAATVIALDAMKERVATETKDRLTEDFINDLLKNRIKNLESIQKRSEELNLSLTKKRIVAVLNIKDFEYFYLNNYKKGEKFIQEFKNKLKKILDDTLNNSSNSKGFSVWQNGDLIVLPEVENINEAKEVVKTIVERVKSETDEILFSIGIGDICKSPLELHRSYQEAKEAINIGEKLNKRFELKSGFYCFNDLGVYQIFMGIIDNTHYLKKFCKDRLQPIIDYEKNKSMDLLVTLETFLDCQHSFKETSQKLFVHNNTVKYRIQKIEEILGYDPFKDFNESFNLHLAVKANKIL